MSGAVADTPDVRYPIGKFDSATTTTDADVRAAIDAIAALPSRLRAAVTGLNETQLDTPYRDGGWTVRQLVHHVADSHMNAYVRCKLALTEDSPAVKTYEEARWAELRDVREIPVETSLVLLEMLHQRWVSVLRGLTGAELERGFVHPEHGRLLPLREVVGLYAWHGRHHTAHATRLRERMGWG